MELPIRGGSTKIDDQDYGRHFTYRWSDGTSKTFRVSDYSWYRFQSKRSKTSYACITIRSGGKRRITYLHRLILELAPGEFPDHKDGDGLNNQRDNLRLATRPQNAANTTGHSEIIYKGVTKTASGEYQARIGQRSLGHYSEAVEAAIAYDRAAEKAHGEFAHLNFPDVHREALGARKMTSQYKGVSWDKASKKWRANTYDGKKFVSLGRFEQEEQAAEAVRIAEESGLGYKPGTFKAGPRR